MLDRDFPDLDRWGHHRKAVCKLCHWVMTDCEPMTSCGEFWHLAPKDKPKAFRCKNNGQRFGTDEHDIEPFLKKGRRRFLKRAGIRA